MPKGIRRQKRKYLLLSRIFWISTFLLVGFSVFMFILVFLSTKGVFNTGVLQDQNIVFGLSATLFTILVLLVIILFFAIVIMYILLLRKQRAIKMIIAAGHKLSSGDLAINVSVKDNNEISDLTNIINDVATNFQEILLLVGSYSNDLQAKINMLDKHLKSNPSNQSGLKDTLNEIRGNIHGLQQIVQDFNFYKVKYNSVKITGKD